MKRADYEFYSELESFLVHLKMHKDKLKDMPNIFNSKGVYVPKIDEIKNEILDFFSSKIDLVEQIQESI